MTVLFPEVKIRAENEFLSKKKNHFIYKIHVVVCLFCNRYSDDVKMPQKQKCGIFLSNVVAFCHLI